MGAYSAVSAVASQNTLFVSATGNGPTHLLILYSPMLPQNPLGSVPFNGELSMYAYRFSPWLNGSLTIGSACRNWPMMGSYRRPFMLTRPRRCSPVLGAAR